MKKLPSKTRPRRVSTKPATCIEVVSVMPGKFSAPVPVRCEKPRAARGRCTAHLNGRVTQALENRKKLAVNTARRAVDSAIREGTLPRAHKGSARVHLQRIARTQAATPTV